MVCGPRPTTSTVQLTPSWATIGNCHAHDGWHAGPMVCLRRWSLALSSPVAAVAVIVATVVGCATGAADGQDGAGDGEGEGEGVAGGGEGEGEAGGGEGEGEAGGGEGEGEAGGGEGEGEGETVDDNVVAVDVVASALRPGRVVDDGLRVLFDMVANASTLTGGNEVTVTGTVNFRTTPPTYSAAPASELVYLDNPGIEVRVVVGRFAGDFNQGSGTDFYVRPHDVSFTRMHLSGDDFGGESELGSDGTGTRAGSGSLAGGHAFSFSSTQQASFQFGTGTVQTEQVEVRLGTLTGPGLNLRFQDGSRYLAVLVDNFSEDLQTGLTISGTAGGSSWSMTDGLIKRTFSNGRAVEPDFWAGTSGTLRRNGTAFATLAAQSSAPAISIVLQTPAGPAELESHGR